MNLKKSVRNIYCILSSVRLIPHGLLWFSSRNFSIVRCDLERWSAEFLKKELHSTWDAVLVFVEFMTFFPEFRTLFYYRMGWASKILQPLCQPMPLLDIGYTEEGIGPGLIIFHGRATGIKTTRIGRNCTIFQHVSIGANVHGNAKPILGDNVYIYAGAKVYGNIRIGNNSIVGANAVVVKDVPDNCTVAGVPARIVRRDGRKVDEKL